MKNKILFTLIAFGSAISSPAQHENCDHPDAPTLSDGSLGVVVEVTPTAAKNIGLKLEKVEKRKIAETVTALGKTEFQPDMASEISARISGRVEKLHVKPFDKVKKGQLLMSVQSLLPGNPPPVIEIYSPRDGVVESLFALEGGLVEAGKSLGRIVNTSKLYAVAKVFESKLESLKLGQTARIKFEAFPEKTFQANLVKFGTSLDAENSTLPVYFEIKNENENLRFGMRGYFSIIVSEDKQTLCVPISAVMGEFGNKFVYVQDCEKTVFIRREVALGNSDDSFVEILSGLHEGEVVVSDGNYHMQFMPAPKDYEPHSHDDEEDEHEEEKLPAEKSKDVHHDHSKCKDGNHEHNNHEHAKHEHENHNHSHDEKCENHNHDDHETHEDCEQDSSESLFEKDSYAHYLILSMLVSSLILNFVFMFAAALKRKGKKNS